MNAHLFVYGTLLSTAGHPMGRRLMREGRLIGEACMQGQLYRLGAYPGLAETHLATQRVHGEVFKLHDPPKTLIWLDAYEGIAAGNPAHDEYRRATRMVHLASGEQLAAWVYLYQKDTSGFQPISDGRWEA
jgi:gamma-glutamylcyclotransferase (GGCT)/AIG2-like uncharacterized protein YtfP